MASEVVPIKIGRGVQDDGNIELVVGQEVNIALGHIYENDPKLRVKLSLVKGINRILTEAEKAGLVTGNVPTAFRAMIEDRPKG